MNLGPAEILVILVVALIVFGPKRLPEVGRQIGSAMRELRRMQDSVRAEIDTVMKPDLSPHDTTAASSSSSSPPALEEPDHTTTPYTPTPTEPSEPNDGFAEPGTFS